MKALAELFPDEDHRFHLTLRRGEPAAFFAPTPGGTRLLAERIQLLDTNRDRHAALLAEGEPLRAAFAELIDADAEWGTTVAALGRRVEPDFLLLAPDSTGAHLLLGGVLCFPTGWSLEARLGRPLEAIHGVVPGLNMALAAPMRQFMSRLKPGPGFLRANWGLAATPELNLHPALNRPRLAAPLNPERVWLRVERQMLACLPHEVGLVFGIRVELHPLADVLADPVLRAGFHRALVTMPAPLAIYKGLAPVMEELKKISA